MPSTHIPVPEKDYGSPLNHSRRSSDDLRRQISRLKSDLEAEKAKVKQFNRDKIAEVKRIQENADKEKQKALDSLVKRLQAEHAVELKRQRESVVREKETELRQVLKFKDEEVKTLKNQIQEEKEKTKRAEDDLRRQLVDKSKGESADIEGKLRNEISVIKDEKHKLEELFKLKSAADSEKAEIIRRLQTEHKVERHKLIKEAKRASAKEMQQIRSTERALEEKSQELAFKDQLTRRLEAEKDELRRRRESSEWDSSRKSLKLDSLDEDFIEGREDCNYIRRDRERDLIKKNADLQTEVQHLEKKCAMLQKHQSSRHESPKVHANTEEKIKKLKKRNAELVAIARQLEEKAKRLQDEKISSTSSPDVEHVKRMFAKKRAKDLAEHAKLLLAKDSELDELRNQLGVGKIGGQVENDKIKELESIIRQSERERLLLEKQIQSPVQSRVTSPLHLDETVDSRQRLEALEDENEELKTTVKKLENIEDERLTLSWQLKEKTEECKRLMNDLEEKQAKCARLELEREKFVAKCTMLQKKNSEMTKKMKHLKELEREIVDMKENLQKAEELHKTSEAECNKLKSQLENLLQVQKDLRASEEKRKHLEEEKMVTAKILAERDEEIQQLYKIQEEANRAHEMTVTTLDDEIRVLEQKCSETEDKYKSLHDKMETMKKQPSKRSVETAHKQTQTTSRPPSPTARGAANLLESKQVNDSRGNAGADLSVLESHLTPGVAGKRAVNGSQGETSGDEEIVIGRVGKPEQDSSDVNLDQVSDRLRQLVAMDTTSEEETLSGTEKTTKQDDTGQMVLGDGGEDELAALSRRISMAAMTESNSSSVSSSEDNKYDSDTSLNLTGNLGDLEDNQKDSSAPEDEQLELAETKRKTGKNKRLNHYLPERPGKESTSGSEEGSLDEKYLSQDDSQISTEGGEEEKLAVFIARYSYDPYQHSPNDNPEAELAFQAGEYLYVFGEMDEDGFYIGELMSGQRGLVPSNFVERVADENDMPWLVTGEEDEDPSDNDEGERKGRQHMNLRMSLDHFPDANLEDIEEEDEEEDCDMRSDDSAEDSQEAVISQDGLTSDDTDLEPFRVPSPKRLSLERQFSRSVLLCWKPPNDMSADDVKGYGVYVNGELKMRINGPNKTKALVEDIEPNETYRLSVRTITSKGEESVDREAMLTIGKDASLAPSQLQTTHLSPTSAKIEWLPGNSSFAHDIFLNDTYQRTIRPGTYQHTLMNLEPNQDYRVTVRARDPKLFLDHKGEMGREIRDPLASETEFRTEAGGLPEPPVNVQILGNQPTPRGLEVTWIPVTITEKGTSNGARVTGYKVYINAVPCTEVTSPLADSVAVAPWMVERSAKKSVDGLLRVTVRTQCVEGESVDSNKVEIPFDMLKFKASKLFKNKDGNKGFEEPCELVAFKQLDSTEECFVNGGLEEEHPEGKTVNGNVEIDRVSGEGLRLQKDNNENIIQPVQPLESQTKGKGVLWRGGIQDDSDLSDSGCSTRVEKAWSSESEQENKDDEEDLELHNSLPSQQTQNEKHLDGMPPDISFESLEVVCNVTQNEEQFEDLEFCKLPNEGKRVQSQENVDSLNSSQDGEGKTRPSNSLSSTGADSSASEFDMEEFDASLKALQSSSRKKDPNKESAGDVVIRPLQSDESDMEEDLSETPLSVIEEEEEENVESEIAVSIRSGSISEGFRSDDDVMDLLDDGPDSGEFVPASYKPTMITEFPKSDKDLADIEPLSNVERRTNSLSKYLPTASSSEDKELNNNPTEETPSKEDAEQNASFSDAEVDHDNLQKAHVTSTPVGSPRPQHGNTSEVDTSADYTESGREIEDIASIPTDNSTEAETDKADRTYTIEQHERTTAADGEKMKIFIALYDYDPRTMSPNADAEEEELAFREGDLIKIYGDKDDDGFYWGEAHGRQGFVPFNLVSEVQLEDGEELSLPTSPAVSSPPIPTQPVDSSPQQNTSHEQDGGTDETEYEDPRNSANFSLVPKRMVALFDYDPQQLSPNPDNEVELTFRVGDVIFVYGDMDPDGFYTGELRGVRGLVPSNFLEDLPDADDAVQISQTNQVSPQDKIITANGTSHIADETVKKKKGIFAKGKNLFKKITKEKKSKR